MSADTQLRFSRQEGLVPPDAMKAVRAVVVGAGAVGRQVCLQLAAMGVTDLLILDPDTVGEENIAPQGFANGVVGSSKARVVKDECWSRRAMDAKFLAESRRFGRADKNIVGDAHMFCCVDSMTSRRLVWEACVAGGAKWFGDARAAGETIQVISESAVRADSLYASPDVLFDDSQAFVGTCSTKMTQFTACVAASYLVARFAQNLRGAKMGFNNVRLNLLFDDLSEPVVRPPEPPKPAPVEQVLNEVLDLNPPLVVVDEMESSTAV